MKTDAPTEAARVAPALLAAAPHRLLFFVGATNVLAAMAWWCLWLAAAQWPTLGLRQPSVPAGWMHAVIMQYQVLPPFMFGFLLTVFPRWMGLPPLTRWHYVPVGVGLFGGQVLVLAGLSGSPLLVYLGLVQTFAGWTAGLGFLVALLLREREQTTWHAWSAASALALGWVGLGLVLAYMFTGNPRLMFAAIKFGSFGLLLPIYVTVAHRMFPFFAGNIVPGYWPWRPLAWLAAFWPLCLAHLALELAHGYAWLWLADLPLLALTAYWAWRNWPRRSSPSVSVPPLLRVLFYGYAWLPVALALYSIQSLWFVATDAFVLGRAPAHALFIGFFGSLLVAMVTRVTQGHSGRPLVLGPTATFAFVVVQGVAVLRICAELHAAPLPWEIAAAAGWLLAFLPWVLRSTGIYLRPRVDGKDG